MASSRLDPERQFAFAQKPSPWTQALSSLPCAQFPLGRSAADEAKEGLKRTTRQGVRVQTRAARAAGGLEWAGENFRWRFSTTAPIVPAMAGRATDATFEAVERKDGSGWYVRLTRPEMLPQRIGDFRTEAEARAWIDAKSAEWLVRYGAS